MRREAMGVTDEGMTVRVAAAVRLRLAAVMMHLVSPGVQRTLAREIARRAGAEGGSDAAVERWLPAVVGEAAAQCLSAGAEREEETILAAVQGLAGEAGDVREGLAALRGETDGR